MGTSTVHRIHDTGTATPQNVVRLAKVAGMDPKIPFIRMGWFDEELVEGDPHVQAAIRALGMVPPESRRFLVETMLVLAERMQAPENQGAILPYLQGVVRPEDER